METKTESWEHLYAEADALHFKQARDGLRLKIQDTILTLDLEFHTGTHKQSPTADLQYSFFVSQLQQVCKENLADEMQCKQMMESGKAVTVQIYTNGKVD